MGTMNVMKKNQASSAVKCWKWDISGFISNQVNSKYAVVVLNRIIPQKNDFIKNLWNNATLNIAVDGGMVHWDNFVNKLPESDRDKMKLPDLITGDFDSITKDILEKYKKKDYSHTRPKLYRFYESLEGIK